MKRVRNRRVIIKRPFACLNCKKITFETECPECKSPTSEEWKGMIIILNPEKSTVAKLEEVGLKHYGKYAIVVK